MTVNPQNPCYNYTQLSATANLHAGAQQLGGIFVSAASATPTITIYDSATTTTTTKLVDVFTPVAGTWYSMPFTVNSGIYVVISGTVSATVAWL